MPMMRHDDQRIQHDPALDKVRTLWLSISNLYLPLGILFLNLHLATMIARFIRFTFPATLDSRVVSITRDRAPSFPGDRLFCGFCTLARFAHSVSSSSL